MHRAETLQMQYGCYRDRSPALARDPSGADLSARALSMSQSLLWFAIA